MLMRGPTLAILAVALLTAGCGQADDAARIKQLEERLERADRRADQAIQARKLAEQRLEELQRQTEDEELGESVAADDDAGYADDGAEADAQTVE